MKTIKFLFLSLCASVLLAACSQVPHNNDFQLIIFNDGWTNLPLGYTGDQALPILLNLDTSDSLIVIDLDEIEQYDWEAQVIRLTKPATDALLGALVKATHGEEGVVADMYEELGWGDSIAWDLYTKAFVVKVNGSPLYGGIFLDPYSQMAIDYPVVRVTIVEERAELAILPVHIPFVMVDPIGSAELVIAQSSEDTEEIFRDLIQDISAGDVANGYRRLIRDADIKAIMDAAGKLK